MLARVEIIPILEIRQKSIIFFVVADVLVHRQLLGSLGLSDAPSVINDEKVSELAAHINRRHRASKNVQKDSAILFQTIFFRNRGSEVLESSDYVSLYFTFGFSLLTV